MGRRRGWIVVALALVAALVGLAAGDAQATVGRPVPARLLDTRAGGQTVDGLAAGGGRVAAAATIEVTVAGRGGVPATGVAAVAINVTAVDPSASGYVTVWPTGAARPNASNLNFVAGQTVPNLVVVAVGSGGRISLFNAAGTTDLLVDVQSWFPDDGSFGGVVPARLLDSRPGGQTVDGLFAGVGRVQSAGVDIGVLGRAGVPASGVAAVVVNVTVVAPSDAGFVTVRPAGALAPNASNLNFSAGQTVPNLAVVPVGLFGAISLSVSSGSTHLLVDVQGWFADDGSFGGVVPARLADTRAGGQTIDGFFAGIGPSAAGGTVEVGVLGRGGVPEAGIAAVVVNVTVVDPAAAGFVTVWPTGGARPNASNLNFAAGQTVPNLVIVPVGANGRISLSSSSASADLLVDVQAWLPDLDVLGSGGRGHFDRPDDISGPQVHLVYVVPAYATDRQLDTNGSIHRSIGLVQDWLDTQSGGQRLRLDTFNGLADITYIRLGKSDARIASMGPYVREMIERGMHDTGHLQPDKIYLAYYDGTSTYACGGGSYPPTIVGPVVALYLQGLPDAFTPCGSGGLGVPGRTRPAYLDIAMLHEFGHAIGLAPACAPHHSATSHVNDSPTDLMWTGPAPWDVDNMVLDVNHDDYFAHSIPGCNDLQESAFLTPTLGAGWMPDLWGGVGQALLPQFG